MQASFRLKTLDVNDRLLSLKFLLSTDLYHGQILNLIQYSVSLNNLILLLPNNIVLMLEWSLTAIMSNNIQYLAITISNYVQLISYYFRFE